MAKQTLTCELSSRSVRALRNQLKAYADSLDHRCSALLDRLSEIGVQTASQGFASAQYDGVNDVSVKAERVSDAIIRIVASGEAVAFIEFGSGVIGGGHPEAGALGFGPGTYPGKGHWDNPKGWTFYGEDGGTNGVWVRDGVWRTRGNPPAMAMHNANEEMLRQILSISREVFRL